MPIIESGSLIQKGLIKSVDVLNEATGQLESGWISTLTGKVVPQTQYFQLLAEVASLGVNEATILTGKLTDPYRLYSSQ